MRLLQLDLKAFGPFTDVSLDFSSATPGLHIVYGPNEAGKTTALRALQGLLYGIPTRSTDNFVHSNAELRVGGRLCQSDGEQLVFLRRKGNKDTLLDLDHKALPEGVLLPFLHGVDVDQWTNIFGIDHEELIRGGEEIRSGGGELGQTLFSAGLGGAHLREVLTNLDSEAEELFKPRGSNQALNRTLHDYAEARREVGQQSLSSRQWSEHDKALGQAREHREAVGRQLQERQAEQSRGQRLQSTLPRLAARQEALAALAALGKVPRLPDDAPEKRRAAQRSLVEARQGLERARQQLQQLEQQAGEIEVPEDLLAQQTVIEELYKTLGSYIKAQKDRPSLEGKRRQLLTDAETLRADLAVAGTVAEVAQLRPRASARTQLQELAADRARLVTEQRSAERDLQKDRDELKKCEAALALLPPSQDPADLQRVIARLRPKGDLEELLRNQQAALVMAREQAQAELGRLGLWQGELTGLELAPVPSDKTVARFARDFRARDTALDKVAQRLADTETDLAEAQRQLEALQLSGAVPVEEDLVISRQRRETGWQLVRRAWLDKEEVASQLAAFDPDHELPEAYEQAVSGADEVADRLRREADRVAQRAELDSRQSRTKQTIENLKAQQTAAAREREAVQQAWLATWQPAGITPLPPEEMAAWLTQLNALLGHATQLHEREAEVERLSADLAQHQQALAAAMTALGCTAETSAPLSDLLAQAESVVEEITSLARTRQDLREKHEQLGNQVEAGQRGREETTTALAHWQTAWAAAVGPLGLSPEATPAQVNTILTALDELSEKLKEAVTTGARVEGIDRDARAFATKVEALLARVAPDLKDLSSDQAAGEMHERLKSALLDKQRLAALAAQIEEKRQAVEEAEEAIETATAALRQLCREAGCDDPENLPEVEERSATAWQLKEKISHLETDLTDLGGGKSLAELAAETAGVDGDTLPGQLQELTQAIAALDEQRTELDRTIGEEQHVLALMDGSDAAAAAAERAETLLARARQEAEQYMIRRLAASLLRREIERYREANQDPILRRAGELFVRLTLGSFSRLQIAWNEKDQPEIAGVRRAGEIVAVEGMSDGTRDQLYLALRLASLEHYLETNEPMPFVVDDLLIRFDDDRSRATLEILSELADRTQVIFFTHHARLVELAEGLRRNNVSIHRLQH